MLYNYCCSPAFVLVEHTNHHICLILNMDCVKCGSNSIVCEMKVPCSMLTSLLIQMFGYCYVCELCTSGSINISFLSQNDT